MTAPTGDLRAQLAARLHEKHAPFTDDGDDQIVARFEDRDGDMPPLVEVLGMLAMTTDTAIRTAMGEAPEADR